MRWGTPLALSAAIAAPATARFAPATHAPYRLTIEAVRDDGRAIRRFATDYDVSFVRVRDGYVATLRTVPDSVRDSRGDRDDRFTPLQRRAPVIARLDRAGRLVHVEEAEAAWARLRATIAAVAVDGRDAILAAHDRASPAERDRTLAGDLLAICAGADADRGDGLRDTVLPAAGGPPLPVRETARRARDSVTITTTGVDQGASAFSRHRTIDRRTGLVREAVETRQFAHPGSTTAVKLVRTMRLGLMVSEYPSAIQRKP